MTAKPGSRKQPWQSRLCLSPDITEFAAGKRPQAYVPPHLNPTRSSCLSGIALGGAGSLSLVSAKARAAAREGLNGLCSRMSEASRSQEGSKDIFSANYVQSFHKPHIVCDFCFFPGCGRLRPDESSRKRRKNHSFLSFPKNGSEQVQEPVALR